MKDKIKLFGWLLVFLICIGVMFFGMIYVNIKDDHGAKKLKIANPLTEVSNVSEMQKYLGFKVPIIADKEVNRYIVIGKNKYANHARIIYKDNSEFDMEKGDSDVSGIYGGELVKKESIGGVSVTIYKYEDTIYALWKDNEFSYSYAMFNQDENALNEDINKLMKVIK